MDKAKRFSLTVSLKGKFVDICIRRSRDNAVEVIRVESQLLSGADVSIDEPEVSPEAEQAAPEVEESITEEVDNDGK